MKKLISFALLLLVLAGCTNPKETENIEKPEVVEEVVYVNTSNIIKDTFRNELSLPSKLEPKENVIITSKVSADVSYINKDIGDKVQRGNLIARLDDTIYRLQYDKAKVALKNARNNYNIAETNYEDLQTNYNRNKELHEKKFISDVEFEALEKAFNIAKDNLDSAKVGVIASENDLALANENLKNTYIKAPITGIVSEKNISVGENVNPGARIFSVVNIDKLLVNIGVSEEHILKIKEDMEITISVDNVNIEFKGKVTNISPILDSRTNTYKVIAEIENEENLLKAGMFANVEILFEEKESLAIQKEAIYKNEEGNYIFVIEDNRAKIMYVETGLKNEKNVEILSEIPADLEIITLANSKLKNGVKIEVNSLK